MTCVRNYSRANFHNRSTLYNINKSKLIYTLNRTETGISIGMSLLLSRLMWRAVFAFVILK